MVTFRLLFLGSDLFVLRKNQYVASPCNISASVQTCMEKRQACQLEVAE